MYAIRVAPRTADIDYLVKIDAECFDKPWKFEHWEQSLRTDKVVIATRWGTPVGFLVYRQDQVIRFAVRVNHRRQGLATSLFNEVKGRLRNVHTHVLEDCLYHDHAAVGKFLSFNKFVPRLPIKDGIVHFIWSLHVRRNAKPEESCDGR